MTHMVYGVMGSTEGFKMNRTTITEDNDGVFATGYASGTIDLTRVLSRALGRQLSQMATYRINYISVQLRNVDDTVDNNNSAFFGGNLRYYNPTKHRVDALQLARAYARARVDGAFADDPFAKFTDDKDYKGLRYNWSGDDNIEGANLDNSSMAGDEFAMTKIFSAYDSMIGGTPSAMGYDTGDTQGAALWESRTAHAVTNGMQWVTSLSNRVTSSALLINDYGTDMPQSDDWQWYAPNGNAIDVLGGLLKVDLTHGNTDTFGTTEDEFELLITIGVAGWDEF
jgi:hypothetical protein